MVKLLLAMALAAPISAYSKSNVSIDYMNLELKRMPFQRDFYIPGQEKWDYELSLNFRTVFGRGFLESDLTGQTYGSRFRNMWWDYTLGFKLFDAVDLVWDHRSQHSLDLETFEKFPVRDSYGVRINFK